jgi:hypothetical protein
VFVAGFWTLAPHLHIREQCPDRAYQVKEAKMAKKPTKKLAKRKELKAVKPLDVMIER